MEQVSRKIYSDVHIWLRDKFGVAVACESTECDGKSGQFQYALKAGKTHKKLRGNYMTLCQKCHSRYDTKHKNRGHVYNKSRRLSMKFLWQELVNFPSENKTAVSTFLEYIAIKIKAKPRPKTK